MVQTNFTGPVWLLCNRGLFRESFFIILAQKINNMPVSKTGASSSAVYVLPADGARAVSDSGNKF